MAAKSVIQSVPQSIARALERFRKTLTQKPEMPSDLPKGKRPRHTCIICAGTGKISDRDLECLTHLLESLKWASDCEMHFKELAQVEDALDAESANNSQTPS